MSYTACCTIRQHSMTAQADMADRHALLLDEASTGVKSTGARIRTPNVFLGVL